MTQQQSQIFMNWLALPVTTRIISGAGPIFEGLGLRELVTAIFWTFQTQSPSEKEEIKKAVKKLPVLKDVTNDDEQG